MPTATNLWAPNFEVSLFSYLKTRFNVSHLRCWSFQMWKKTQIQNFEAHSFVAVAVGFLTSIWKQEVLKNRGSYRTFDCLLLFEMLKWSWTFQKIKFSPHLVQNWKAGRLFFVKKKSNWSLASCNVPGPIPCEKGTSFVLIALLYDTYKEEPLIPWQSRDSIPTVAPSCSLGLLNRIEWHSIVEIQSRDCQDMFYSGLTLG